MIGKILGNLKIVSKIGEGGMGTVYVAENIRLNNRFAVKSLAATLTQDSGFRERFKQEAQNQALLNHPNIVQAIDFLDEGGEFFLVMEYVNGQGLNELIKKTGKLPEDEALRIFKDILRGLNFAHKKGVIHRDIKPSNVIVDGDGRARITDFGIAILVGEKRLTTPGAIVGSSWYMSPEQILHPAEIDHRADLYATGIVLYEMLTGDVPFDGKSEFSIQEKQIKDTIPDPSKINPLISAELKKIMMKALEKDPDKRYSGCGEFISQIEEYEKTKIHSPSPIPRWKFFVAIASVIGTIAVAYKFGSSSPPSDSSSPQDSFSPLDVSTYERIKDTTEKASILCRDIKEFEIHQARAQVAINANAYTDLAKQIMTERKNSIDDQLSGYSEDIKKLSYVEKTLVDEQLSNYNNDLAKEERFHRIKITPIVAQHYLEATRKGSIDVSIEKMSKLCHTME